MKILIKSIAIILLFLSLGFTIGCDETSFTVADDVADAENILFTGNGRLFFTGADYLYEYNFATGKAVPVDGAGKGNFLGIAQSGNMLYVVKTSFKFDPQPIDFQDMLTKGLFGYMSSLISDLILDKKIIKADLNQPLLNFESHHVLYDMFLPNGMTADTNGNLYLADTNFMGIGKIVRISSTNGLVSQSTWLKTGVTCPNGMSVKNGKIYFTDFDIRYLKASVKRVDIKYGAASNLQTIYSKTGFFDDLDAGKFYGKEGCVVADHLDGTIIFLNDSGKVEYKLDKGSFSFPSSVRLGKGVFENTLLITEKGILYDLYSNIGNKVSGFDLE